MQETPFAHLVRKELKRARTLGHGKMASLHEGYAVILEEVDELWDECRKKKAERSSADILTELIQISAMCQRTAEDLGLIGQTPLDLDN